MLTVPEGLFDGLTGWVRLLTVRPARQDVVVLRRMTTTALVDLLFIFAQLITPGFYLHHVEVADQDRDSVSL